MTTIKLTAIAAGARSFRLSLEKRSALDCVVAILSPGFTGQIGPMSEADARRQFAICEADAFRAAFG